MKELAKRWLNGNKKGSVLIISLLILSAMLILAISSIFTTTLDMKIATNTKTATRSLYIADSGLNRAKKDLLDAAASRFIATPPTPNTTEHEILSRGDVDGKTLRNTTNWGLNVSPFNCASFPCTISYGIAAKTASVEIPVPVWEASLLNDGSWVMGAVPINDASSDPNFFTLTFKELSSTETETGIKIVANIRAEFGNNLLFFQAYPTLASPGPTTVPPTYDLGIDALSAAIEGVATNFEIDKILFIYKLESATTNLWEIFGEPLRSTSNFTFRLADGGTGNVYYYPQQSSWFPGSLTYPNAAGEPEIDIVSGCTVGAYSNLRLPKRDTITGKILLRTGATIASDRGPLDTGQRFRVEVKGRSSSLIPTNQLLRLEERNAEENVLSSLPFSTLAGNCTAATGPGAGCTDVTVRQDCTNLLNTQWKTLN